MNIFVRSHLSTLENDQVSAVRVRWEREKRKHAEEAAPKKGRRKAVKVAAPEPVPVAAEGRPSKRRRTAAEVAQVEAQQQAERAAELAALELERPIVHEPEPQPVQSLEERARALFRELPPAPAEAEEEAGPALAEPPVVPAQSAAPAGPTRAPFIPPRIQRPAPGTGAPGRAGGAYPSRLKRVLSSSWRAAPVLLPAVRAVGFLPARLFGPVDDKGCGRKKGKKGKRSMVDQEAVQANILRTLQNIKGGTGARKGVRRSDEPSYREQVAGRLAEEREKEKTRIRVNEYISVSELAEAMKVPATQIVQFAFKELGMMVTVNQRLDFDQIELIASEFGFQAVREEEYAAEAATEEVDQPGEVTPRPPVVTIMGHVDHGKTSLLDYIRKTNVVAGEAGGITQHIGAYHIALPGGRSITFLDTPGHQAFTAMRARGAQVTDIVVLVVAADDQVMPQTIEAIIHARNAGVPMIVAINKIDLPAADVDKVKRDLLQQNVVLEEFGGKVLSAAISAKKGTGVDHLLEQLLLQAELLDLTANAGAPAHGTVLDQRGTLHVGDNFICGKFSGRVRALYDERGKTVKEAGPSIPVQILGFEGVPSAGDSFAVVTDAVEAREIAQKRQRLEREAQNRRSQRGGTLEDISRALKEGEVTNLRIIIKADQGGPAEALADALAQLSTSEVRVDVAHRGVGAITESDVLLAKASGAIILGFHVRPDANARSAAEREHVNVRTYRVIYEAVEDVRNA